MYVSKWVLRRRPVFEHFFGTKEDVEYEREGFMTVFMKASKPNGDVMSAPLRTAEDDANA
jgi:hypothetical protein